MRPALLFRCGVVRSGGATRLRGQPAVMKRRDRPCSRSPCCPALRSAVTRRFDIASRSAATPLDVAQSFLVSRRPAASVAPRGPHESSVRADGCPRARPERSPPTDLPTSWSAEPTTIGRGTRNAAPRSAATGTRAQEHARPGDQPAAVEGCPQQEAPSAATSQRCAVAQGCPQHAPARDQPAAVAQGCPQQKTQ